MAACLFLCARSGHSAEPRVQVAMRFSMAFGEKGGGLGAMREPRDVAVDAAGNIYVADTGNNRVQKFSSRGLYVSEVGGFGWDAGQFNRPTGVATSAGLEIIVSDSENQRLSVFTQHLQLAAIVGGRDVEGVVKLGRLGGVAVSREGEIYATDIDIDQVVQVSSFSRTDRTFTGYGYGAGDLRRPSAVDVGEDGSVVVADTENGRVVMFDRFGGYKRTFGEDALSEPSGVCLRDGVVYVSDTGNHRVVAFDAKSGQLAGKMGGPDPSAEEGSFRFPMGLAVDGDRLLVVDSGNGRIQVFKLLVLRK